MPFLDPTMSDPITATIRYVRRDGHLDLSSEKPYILHYAAPSGFPQNNFAIESVPGIAIHNLRTAGISYNDHGMAIASLNDGGDGDPTAAATTSWQADDFDDDDWVERVYLPALHRCVCTTLGAHDVVFFDWMLRKRTPSFPKRDPGRRREDGGELDDEAAQPSLSAHIGKGIEEEHCVGLMGVLTWMGCRLHHC